VRYEGHRTFVGEERADESQDDGVTHDKQRENPRRSFYREAEKIAGARGAVGHHETAEHEEDEHAIDAENLSDQPLRRFVRLGAFRNDERVREDDQRRRADAQEIE
jgi:hypothetical protein